MIGVVPIVIGAILAKLAVVAKLEDSAEAAYEALVATAAVVA